MPPRVGAEDAGAAMYGTGVVPLLPPEVRRERLMSWRQIDLVIDVGANSGQYGGALRAAGYGGRILSFEPLAEAFAMLSERCLEDPLQLDGVFGRPSAADGDR